VVVCEDKMTQYLDEINNLIKKCEDFTNSLHIFSHNYFNCFSNDHKGCFIDYADSSSFLSQRDSFLKYLILRLPTMYIMILNKTKERERQTERLRKNLTVCL